MYTSGILLLGLGLAVTTTSLPDGNLETRQEDYQGQETQLTFFGYPDNCDDVCLQFQHSAPPDIANTGSDRLLLFSDSV